MVYQNSAMLRMFLLLPIFTLHLLFGAYGIEFDIASLLNDREISIDKHSHVKVTENCSSGDNVAVSVKIPLTLNFNSTNDEINVFFANDEKEILQTSLKNIVRGAFFSIPYKMEKTMEGSEVRENITENYTLLEVNFPKAWLPKNCTKISASIQIADGNIYNYYDIRNFEISMPDLMVTEEYKNYECDPN